MVESQNPNTSTSKAGTTASGHGDEDFAAQAQNAMSNAANHAGDMWDDAYEQGGRYYRQGSQALGNLDSTTLTGLFVAGAVGFGIAWLMFGQRGTDDVARGMSKSGRHGKSGGQRRGSR